MDSLEKIIADLQRRVEVLEGKKGKPGRPGIGWKIKYEIWRTLKNEKVNRVGLALKYGVSVAMINKIAISKNPCEAQYEKETGKKLIYSKPGIIEDDTDFENWKRGALS